MSLSEIAMHLGLGIEVIEPKVVELCGKGQGKIINGSFITQVFVDLFLEELSEQVTDLGRMALSDLTNKQWLPIEYVKDVINDAKAGQLPKGATLHGNFIVTDTFSRREVCKVRGIVRGVTRPVSVSQLAQKFKIDELTLRNTIEELIKRNEIFGKISKGLFIPTSF